MADNITLNSGSGGADMATDEISGVHHQRVKVQYGVADSATDVSDSNPLPVDDAGGSLTVDGTVTAELSATDNAVLDQIETNTSYGDNTGAGTEANSLRVTLANDSTGLLSVDDNGGSLTVDNADITTLAGAVDGTEMQVDIVAALPAGTNAIGKLSANSGVDIGDVDVTSQPARAATTDNVGAALLTNVIHNGTAAITPKFSAIDAATSGDNTLVAAVVGKKIRVVSLLLVSAGTVNARFEDGAGGSALSGQMNLVANSGFTLPFNPVGWFETTANTLLNLELSAAISVDGMLTYIEV